eukprot:scaffold871_cov130-Cylindrotheca_fusiformis.AAC.6
MLVAVSQETALSKGVWGRATISVRPSYFWFTGEKCRNIMGTQSSFLLNTWKKGNCQLPL